MSSTVREDYLRAIDRLSEWDERLTTSRLAEAMLVTRRQPGKGAHGC